jgi:hypothetical protein
MPCGTERDGRTDAMTIAGLINVPLSMLEPDRPMEPSTGASA